MFPGWNIDRLSRTPTVDSCPQIASANRKGVYAPGTTCDHVSCCLYPVVFLIFKKVFRFPEKRNGYDKNYHSENKAPAAITTPFAYFSHGW
jgi:hypothetical protein